MRCYRLKFFCGFVVPSTTEYIIPRLLTNVNYNFVTFCEKPPFFVSIWLQNKIFLATIDFLRKNVNIFIIPPRSLKLAKTNWRAVLLVGTNRRAVLLVGTNWEPYFISLNQLLCELASHKFCEFTSHQGCELFRLKILQGFSS